jgi:hypothetical protein
MKEYNYHPSYKHYISSNDAFISPLSAGEYLVSANATLLEPPIVESGKIQIFNENTKNWEIIDDFRGWYYNIFNGEELYNEIPHTRPKNYTNLEPPEDYNSIDYKWDSELKVWKKINQIYKVPEDEINNLSTEEKFRILNISIEELKELLNLNILENLSSGNSSKIKTIETNIKEIISSSLINKFSQLNIEIEDLKKLLEIKELDVDVDIDIVDIIKNLTFEEKKNLFTNNVDEIKSLLNIDELKYNISRCYGELNLLNYQIKHYKNTVIDSFSSFSSKYVNPVNLSEITVLRPVEIIQTSAKFSHENETIPSGFVTICVDTGERKFGDSITPWTKLPFVPEDQKFRFSKTLEEWQDQNPIPGADIECYETDTGNLKVGNGFLLWDKLPYVGG